MNRDYPVITHALTMIQPWATAIVSAGKDVENRPWAPPTRVIGTHIAIHAGAKLDRVALGALAARTDLPITFDVASPPVERAIVGIARVAGFIRRRGDIYEGDATTAHAGLLSRWRDPDALVYWLLDDPIAFERPITCRGQQGLWPLPMDIPRIPHPALLRLRVGDAVEIEDDRGKTRRTHVKQAPWQLGHGAWVAGFAGISGAYLLARCAPVTGADEGVGALDAG